MRCCRPILRTFRFEISDISFGGLYICFVVASPVAYYGVTKWLEHFAYRTPIRWWVFAIAFVAVSAITFITVTFQNWRSANANPVDSLKNE